MEKNIKVVAVLSNWDKLNKFLVEGLAQSKLSDKKKNEICLACEEIYVNISNYAYPKCKGCVKIYLSDNKIENNISVIFEDEGIKFNPLNVSLPKISGTALERKIGGLGIFMAKNLTDKMEYVHQNGKNRLKLVKNISNGGV